MSDNKAHNIKLFLDFDGTITTRDVGDGIFTRFLRDNLVDDGWFDKNLADWKAGIISSHECLTSQCERTIVSEKELQAELEEYILTPGFAGTVSYCRDNGIPVLILSDGLDYYIKYILTKYGINDIPFRSNHMYFKDGVLGVEFPYMERGCGRCGNCKRWHIDTLRRDGDLVVYTGDGYSDRYAIKSADVVFAKGDLAEYCSEKNHEYLPFEDFYTILKYLENINGKKI